MTTKEEDGKFSMDEFKKTDVEFYSHTPFDNKAKKVVLNRLQTTLKDIKRNLREKE